MALKKDKQKVLNETIDDERLREFFMLEAPDGIDNDYHVLERAYRGLQAPDFERFLAVFSERGGNINAAGPNGSLLDVIAKHANGAPYAAAIKKFC